VAIVSEDTRKFVHTHGEDVASGGIVVGNHGHGGGHGDHGEGQTFGPRIGFTHTFREPGLHKIWAECNDHADKRPYEIVFVEPGDAPPDEWCETCGRALSLTLTMD
jgi:hypothetical protein